MIAASEEKKQTVLMITMYVALGFVLAVLFLASQAVTFEPDARAVYDTYVVSPLELFPEPLERLLYLLGISLFPLTFLAVLPLVAKIAGSCSLVTSAGRWRRLLAATTLGGIVGWTVYTLWKVNYFYLLTDAVTPLTVLAAAIVAGLLWPLMVSARYSAGALPGLLTRYLLKPASLLLILLVGLYSVFDLSSVIESPGFEVSFSAVFNAVSQVYLGKQLLVDLTHQYGLYPHFLEPLFRVTGLSVLSFTLVMALLRILLLIAIYRFIVTICENPLVANLGFIGIVYYQFLFGTFGSQLSYDAYFQFHPLRTIFPAVGIYLAYRWIVRKSTALYYFNTILFSFALLWNFDSGFVIFAAWLILLGFQACCDRSYRSLVGHILTGAAGVGTAVALFSLAMLLHYGYFPHLGDFFVYQNLYYRLGYYMLPMPIVHPWNIIMFIYVVALSVGCYSLWAGRTTPRATTAFFLAILGFGLFSYYQGRSHDLGLLGISYPALLLLTLFADYFWRHRDDMPLITRSALYCILCFWLTCAGGVLMNVPSYAREASERLAKIVHPVQTNVKDKISFIRHNTMPGEKVYIRSYLAGLYYLESGTDPTPTVPGRIEMTLRRDFDLIAESCRNQQPRKVFFDRDHAYGNHKFEGPFNETLLACGYSGRGYLGIPPMFLFTAD